MRQVPRCMTNKGTPVRALVVRERNLKYPTPAPRYLPILTRRFQVQSCLVYPIKRRLGRHLAFKECLRFREICLNYSKLYDDGGTSKHSVSKLSFIVFSDDLK